MNERFPVELPQEAELLTRVATLAKKRARRRLSRDKADDLAHDVVLEFLEMLREGTFVIVIGLLPGLVKTMVDRRLRDSTRAQRRRVSRDEQYESERNDSMHVWMSPELMLEQQELDEFYWRTIAALPPMCRRVFVMVREEEMSYQAIANALGLSRAAVNWHVSTAQRRFRTALSEEGIVELPSSRQMQGDRVRRSNASAPTQSRPADLSASPAQEPRGPDMRCDVPARLLGSPASISAVAGGMQRAPGSQDVVSASVPRRSVAASDASACALSRSAARNDQPADVSTQACRPEHYIERAADQSEQNVTSTRRVA